MSTQFVKSRDKFMNNINTTYSRSEVKILRQGECIIIGAITPDDIKTDGEFHSLTYTEQIEWMAVLDTWVATKQKSKNLTKIYSELYSRCDQCLQNKIKARDSRRLQKGSGEC